LCPLLSHTLGKELCMNRDLVPLIGWGIVALAVLIMLAAYKKVLRLFGLFIVPEDSVAIVTKKFVLFGSHRTLPDGRIIALRGEAGIQADTLAPGLHWWLWPWQYSIALQRFSFFGRDAISLLDQLRTFCGDRIDADSARDVLGLAGLVVVQPFLAALRGATGGVEIDHLQYGR